MFAIEFVEFAVIRRVVLRPVPPVPVAPLSDQQLFDRERSLLVRGALGGLRVEVSCVVEIIPGLVVLRRADPYIEVRVDPGSGYEGAEHVEILVTLNGFRNGYCLDPRIILKCIVEAPQELSTRLRKVLPSILAIQNDRNDGIGA